MLTAIISDFINGEVKVKTSDVFVTKTEAALDAKYIALEHEKLKSRVKILESYFKLIGVTIVTIIPLVIYALIR